MAGYPARSASFRTRRDAERWAKTVEAEMIEGRHFRNAEARRRSVGAAIERYLADELPKKRDPQMHSTTLAWWKAEIGSIKLADVTPALLVEKRDKLARGTYQRARPEGRRSKFKKTKPRVFKRSASTVNRYLACISHVFTIARREWHWIPHNPMDGVSKLPEGKGRVRALSDEERSALLEQTRKDATLNTFVVIALSTACRAGELLKLSWADVELKTGRLLFRETKNATPRAVTLYGEALRLLKEHATVRRIGNGPVFENASHRGRYYYDKAFKAAVEAAGIQDFRVHDLRHSAATYLAQQGATEQQLRAIGGWKSTVVSRYVHLAAEDAKIALQRLAEKIDRPNSAAE
jgi:integrase